MKALHLCVHVKTSCNTVTSRGTTKFLARRTGNKVFFYWIKHSQIGCVLNKLGRNSTLEVTCLEFIKLRTGKILSHL